MQLVRLSPCLLALVLLLSACAPVPDPVNVLVTSKRPVTQELPNAILDQISVEDLRVTADLMARDLVLQGFLYSMGKTPIITVKPIENKTDLTIDPDIFQKTIRVKLMEKAGGRILFRDDDSHDFTIEERAKQSGKVQISTTTTRQRAANPTQVGAPIVVQQQAQTNTVLEDSAEVSKRVADADFFLTGLIYSTTEVAQQGAARGMRYFQFQFRLTNTQSNIIMWEKEYMVKREASFK
jgi:PBP1b-binding outer membrane lipoprotein LpoB